MKQDSKLKVEANAHDDARLRLANQLGGIIFYVLLALIALTAIPYGTVQPWWQSLFNCAVFMLAALWLIEGFLKGSWAFSTYQLLYPILALALFALIQTLPLLSAGEESLRLSSVAGRAISADPHGTRQWFFKMLALILVGAMLLRYTNERGRMRSLIALVIGVALASASFGLLRQMLQHQTGFVLPYLKQGFGYGQFLNKNHFAFLMEMACGLLLGLTLWGGLSRERRLTCSALGLLLGGSLVLSNSRGGIFALFCQILFAALLFSVVRLPVNSLSRSSQLLERLQRLTGSLVLRLLLLICLAVIITVGIIWVGGDPLVGSLEAMQTEVGAPNSGIRWAVRRWDIWPATWRMISDHPIAGVGFGGYWMAITVYHNGSGEMTPQEAHNDYLEFLASGGLIGLALGFWFVYELIRKARLNLRRPDGFGRAACCGALAGLAGIAVHSFVDFGLHVSVNALIFMVLIVIATAHLKMDELSTGVGLKEASLSRRHR